MNLKQIGINTRNSVDSAQDRGYWRALVNVTLNLCECGIVPPGSIGHGVS